MQGHSQDICNVEANAIGVGGVPKARAGGRAQEAVFPVKFQLRGFVPLTT